MDIKIPQLGEGADSGSVVSILVKEGDKITKDQTVLEIENEKAVAPIPSSHEGTVTKILVSVGDKVSVGQSIISIADKGGAAPVEETTKEAPPTSPKAPVQAPAAPTSGYVPTGEVYESKSGFPPPASPMIRKVARELGVDLRRVKGSERGGRIILEDLRHYIQALQAGTAPAPQAVQPSKPSAEKIDFSKWGPVSIKPASSLRKKIGEKMSESWTTIPHVTQFDEADITALMQLRKKVGPSYETKKVKLTLTSFAIKAAVEALKKYPQINASLDETSWEIVTKQYYHIGVAVDTDSGLIVPVLKDVDKKSVFEISKELGELAKKTRDRKVSLEDLKGGCFTISNLGGIGGTHFTPIVNKPELAILGLGRGVLKPVVVEKKIETRLMLPVALSYDHRVVDGADGARFIRAFVEALENFKEKEMQI